LLGVMAAALVVATLPPPQQVQGALLLGAAWLLITLYALLRTLYDFTAITHVPFYVPLLLLLANPLVVAGLVVLVLVLQALDASVFLWHLATRT
jgi:hypothetical protein